jgi:hypothetical protein
VNPPRWMQGIIVICGTSVTDIFDGQTFFWKIDYCTPTLDDGSEDPSDPTKATRVLTIICADEY